MATGEIRVLNRTVEVPAINREGDEFFIALTIAQTKLKGSAAFLAFIRDVTEQRKNQEALEQRTKELERSNRNLEEFAHAASHDLKEPIRKIHVFGSRLREALAEHLSENERNLFGRMESATSRMAQLIDDLLAYSQVSQNPHELEEVNLNFIVKQVLEDLELQVEDKKANVIISDLPVVKGYKRQLLQLLQNLISNGLKYSKPDTTPTIQIDSKTVIEDEVPYYLIEIRDDGIGFEQNNGEKIFQLFQRLHNRSEYVGTGIGLAIARKVVDNHKGRIWAESQPGQGAMFKVLLPII